MANVLCVDDEVSISVLVEHHLRQKGHEVRLATNVGEALALIEQHPFDLIIADYLMPNGTGIDLIKELDRIGQRIPVIIMAAFATVEHAVLAIRSGAVDYITKPFDPETMVIAVQQALEVVRLRREHEGLRERITGTAWRGGVVGESPCLRKVMDRIAAVAPTRATILIQGESGTGKELFARAIHEQSPRRDKPFVAVNCAALPEGLVESVLFGHEKGAFTGAAARSQGAFERAHGGTLLLDEISEMRLDLQAKLLRAIQEQEFERVGGSSPIRVDVRLIATTNRDLKVEANAGRFRADLYYRLNVVPIHAPPLRERLDDIPLLVRHFAARAAVQLGVPLPAISAEFFDALQRHHWPGNIRELANVVEHAVILSGGKELGLAALPPDLLNDILARPAPSRPSVLPGRGFASSALPTLNIDELERLAITEALEATDGNRTRAARLLGLSERTLRNKLNTPRARLAS